MKTCIFIEASWCLFLFAMLVRSYFRPHKR